MGKASPMESILKGYVCPHGVDMDRLIVGRQSVPMFPKTTDRVGWLMVQTFLEVVM